MRIFYVFSLVNLLFSKFHFLVILGNCTFSTQKYNLTRWVHSLMNKCSELQNATYSLTNVRYAVNCSDKEGNLTKIKLIEKKIDLIRKSSV